MEDAFGSGTRVSLLGRLRRDPTNQAAWAEFVEHYGAKIYGWCRRWGLQDTDAQDVTQMVLLRLAERMCEFAYDPTRSFRAWLKTLTLHAWSDFSRKQARPGQGSGDSTVGRLLESVEARDDLVKELDAECERQILEEAMGRVRLRVSPHVWEAFRLTALEGLSGAEAGQRIPMPASSVFVAKFRVQKMLQEEVSRLEQAEPNPA